MNRPFHEKLIDRCWSEICQRREDPTPPVRPDRGSTEHESVSGPMDWPHACAALVSGSWASRGFRRRRAVRQVVETLAPSDARRFATWINHVRPRLLDDPLIHRANDWGDPIQAPSWLLGTSRSWSPTSLRYLAHALWLEESGFTAQNGVVLELGVGFGGLAAMMALVTEVSTSLVDLPEVEQAAALQMDELGLANHVCERRPVSDFCFVSNYAFTELSRDVQDRYINEHVRHAPRGVVASNASMFAPGIRGRSNEELLEALRQVGIAAEIDTEAPILGPSDRICGNVLICWDGANAAATFR